jgi:hypothetical protein
MHPNSFYHGSARPSSFYHGIAPMHLGVLGLPALLLIAALAVILAMTALHLRTARQPG